MKRKYLLFASAILAAQCGLAQNPYMNENYMPTDLIGTARYVGMGGALGSLGADISAGASNPAALGLYRRSDAALTFSVLTQKEKPDLNADMTHMSFDQLGFVVSVPILSRTVKYVNFGVNYQKRANFNHAFIADNGSLNGLSQTQQMAEVLNTTQFSTPLADLMYDACLVNPIYITDDQGAFVPDEEGNPTYDGYSAWEADANNYDRVTEGGIYGYDFTLAMNIKDKAYVGVTVGVNDVDYQSYSTYSEFTQGYDGEYLRNYSAYNAHRVDGYGVNVKLGAIVRPIEDSPFRIGLAVESPTIYHLDSNSDYSIDSPFYEAENYDILEGDYRTVYPEYDLAELQMKITTPWKVRVSLGHTVGTYLALGAEYEYANYGKTRQGYQDSYYDDYWGYSYGNTVRDREMDAMHKSTLQGSHSFKFGMELNLTDNLALRLGYNFYSSFFKKEAGFDQGTDSPAFGYQTTTDYMHKGDVNIFTAGLGYHGKHFYADVAYKYRRQPGEFYAFDDYYLTDASNRIAPVDVNLDTHQVFFSVGYKF